MIKNERKSARSPFTGKETTSIWGRLEGRWIYQCPDTGAIFFDRDVITEEDYQDYGAYPYLEEFDDDRISWEVRIRRTQYKKQLNLMEDYAPGRKMLDVGAGPGYLCRVAADQEWKVQGVEISKDAVTFGQEKLDVRYIDIEEVEDGSVDAITCHHVLEHIPQPMAFLQQLRGKLKDGGLLVLHVPHQQPLTFLLRDWLGQTASSGSRDTFCTLYGDIHITGFTEYSLQRVLQEAGFGMHFSLTAGMWTKYYDPFLLNNYLRDSKYVAAARKFVRHLAERIGEPMGKGAWVIGYFFKK